MRRPQDPKCLLFNGVVAAKTWLLVTSLQLSLDCQEYAYVTYKEYQGLMTKFKQIKMMVIGIEIFFGIYLISNILLLIGSIKKIKGLLITWTIYAVIGIALELVFAFKHEKLDKRADNTCSNCKKCIYCVGNHSRLWRNERNRRTKKRTWFGKYSNGWTKAYSEFK